MNVFRSALSLVIHKEGNVSTTDIDQLIDRYKVKKGITLDKEKYTQAVDAAVERYQKPEPCLFICTESRCMKNMYIAPSQQNAEVIGRMLDCEVEMTGCHYKCELAPVLTLKKQDGCITFADCSSEMAWDDALTKCATVLSSKNS
jgi:ABC-type proline/glycine betaine transport system substrate-binding protein